MDRRRFLQGMLAAAGGAVLLPNAELLRQLPAVGAMPASTPLPGSAIGQFVDPVPSLDVITAGTSTIELQMREFLAQVLPTGFPRTPVWSFLAPGQQERASYIGPLIVARRGTPTEIKWVNQLGDTDHTALRAWVDASDQTMHWADPLHDGANVCAEAVEPSNPPMGECAQHYSGPIPAVPHLHGGEVPSVLDGGPFAWFTSDGSHHGPAFYSGDGSAANYAVLRYPNTQPAAPLWFHDHALGVTRLNVYAGLAGAYLLTDPGDPPPANLPAPMPLVVQDRTFTADGGLAFPAGIPFTPNPEHPYWVPEFIGDTIAVNGKVWPFLEVEPKRYRFLFLNGSNARTYEMFFTGGNGGGDDVPMWQIGTDGGYLDVPAPLSRLLLMPGERADVIVDFAHLKPGTRLLLRNIARAPYPSGAPPHGNTTGRVMEARIVQLTAPDTSYDPQSGVPLRRPIVRLVDPAAGALAADVTVQVVRQLTLNEVINPPETVNGVAYPGGPIELLVNNTDFPGTERADFTPVTFDGATIYVSEVPHEGTTEVWELVNLTADAHPIHLHLVQFQLMNRQSFDVRQYTDAYVAAFPGGTYEPGSGPPLDYETGIARAVGGNPDVVPFLRGPERPPAANEAGWKDTVMAPPGQVTRLVVRWAPTDLAVTTSPSAASYPFDPQDGAGYVWHCHILDHEDNEMMRPSAVRRNTAVRTYVDGVDY